MTRLHGREALLSGFRLVARDPKLILAWGAVYFAASVLPQLLIYFAVWPDLLAAMEAAAKSALAGADGGKTAEVARLEARMVPWQLLTVPLGLIGLTAIYGAIYRAILTPEDRKFAYLRLGRAEGAMALTWLASLFLFVVALCAVMLVVLILSLAVRVAVGGGEGVGDLAHVALVLAATILTGWGFVRLSIAPVMAFSEKRFRLLESWALTRGHGWKIFGIYAVVLLAILVIEILVVLIVLLVLFGAGAGMSQVAGIEAIFEAFADRMRQDPGAWMAPIAGAYVLFSLAASVIMAAVYACAAAPVASIYRQLSAEPAEGA